MVNRFMLNDLTEITKLKAQRDELLEALEWAVNGLEQVASHIIAGDGGKLEYSIGTFGRIERCRAALAKAKGA